MKIVFILLLLPVSLFCMQRTWKADEFEFNREETRSNWTFLYLKRKTTNTQVSVARGISFIENRSATTGWETIPIKKITVLGAPIFTFGDAVEIPEESAIELFNIPLNQLKKIHKIITHS